MVILTIIRRTPEPVNRIIVHVPVQVIRTIMRTTVVQPLRFTKLFDVSNVAQ